MIQHIKICLCFLCFTFVSCKHPVHIAICPYFLPPVLLNTTISPFLKSVILPKSVNPILGKATMYCHASPHEPLIPPALIAFLTYNAHLPTEPDVAFVIT